MVNALSTYTGWVGAAKETTYGTPVAATTFIPATDIASEDVKNYVPDTAMRGSAVAAYAMYPTQGWGTFNYGGPVYMDTIGLPLKALLGAEDLSGSGPYVHKFGVNNAATLQPPSYTLVDYNGFEARSFPGAVASQVEFTLAADSLLTMTSTWQALGSSAVTKPSQSFTSKTASAGYVGVITIAGSATTLVKSGTLTLSRNVTPQIAVNASTSPTQIWAADVSYAGSLTIYYTTDAFLTPMLNGTQTAIDVSYTNGADILEIHSTDALFTAAPITRDSTGVMMITVAFTGVANTTDATTAGGGYGPALCTLTNTVTAAY